MAIGSARVRQLPVSYDAQPNFMKKSARIQRPGWLRDALSPLRGEFRAVVFVSAFVNLLAIAAPVFVLQVYDRVIAHAGLATLYGLVAGMGVAILFDFILRQARAKLLQDVALRIDIGLGRRLIRKMLSLPLNLLESRPGAYWQALMRDVEAVRNLFSGATAVLVTDLPFALIFAVIIVMIATPIAWVLAILLPAFMIIGWLAGRLVTKSSERERSAGVSRDAALGEMVAGWETVKGLGLDRSFLDDWETNHAAVIEQSVARGTRADSFLNLGLGFGVAATVLMTAVGALAILDQKMTVGALIAANMLAGRLFSPFQQLTMLWRSYAQTRQSMARLNEVFAMAGERSESPVRFDRPEGRITLDGICFSYDEEPPMLIADLRLNIEPNGFYGLVGANGSGKTTLLKVILGLYAPTEGRVLVDGIDIAQISREDRARWYGYMPQDCRLFAGTIRDNIARGTAGDDTADDQRVIAAARRAGVHDTITGLADGYGTIVSETGSNLSAGVRQRIALARALIHDPVILLLDEPSAHLDHDGERGLCEILSGLAGDHVVIVATHSPMLLSVCNSLLVIEQGRAKWAGTPADILPKLFSGKGQIADEGPAGANPSDSSGDDT
jgi:ATP-binding cassette, subfamily C, bacterial LapB